MSLETRPSAEMIKTRKGDLTIVSVSDIHVGASSTPSDLIVENFKKYVLPDVEESNDIDILFLVGDLLDEALMYSSHASMCAEFLMHYILKVCAKRNITVVALEGTPSHDNGQMKHFEKIRSFMSEEVDFYYVKDISVLHLPKQDIDVLCVPDFTSPDANKIWVQVTKALAGAGVEMVDYSIVHGAFKYQMPNIPAVQAGCHEMDRFLNITRNYIFAGHIHFSSVYGRIYSNGSFDRLVHGEEGDKGSWYAKVRKSGDDDMTFRVNLGAKRYDTFDARDIPIEKLIKNLNDKVEGMPEGSAIRICAARQHPIFQHMKQLKVQHPFIHWTAMVDEGKKEKDTELLVDNRSRYIATSVTSENIASMLVDRITAEGNDPALIERCRHFIERFRT